MYATDFVYDGMRLSDWGYMICLFDSSSSTDNVSLGNQITFNLNSVPGSDKQRYYGSSYQETLTATIQIGNFNCQNREPYPIPPQEISAFMRWINRKDGFHKLKFIQDGYENLYTYASFNATKIDIGGETYGYELTMTSLYPYLLEEQSDLEFSIENNNETFIIYDTSDEIGYIYPNVRIECASSGDLEIYNQSEDRKTIIKNCSVGEVITIDGDNKIISTSLDTHEIQNDFNFVFPRIFNTFYNNENVISVSIPCEMTLSWSPVRKVGF